MDDEQALSEINQSLVGIKNTYMQLSFRLATACERVLWGVEAHSGLDQWGGPRPALGRAT
jgi:hypothetical protein